MSQSTTAAIPSGTLPVSADAPRPRHLIQSIPAEFYNVADDDGKPIAGLIVLNDSTRRPVRAELHLVGASTDDSGRLAIRQAQHILEERYRGPEALPMQVWQSFLRSDPLEVRLPPGGKEKTPAPVGVAIAAAPASDSDEAAIPWKPIVAAAGVLLIALLLWGVVTMLRQGSEQADVTTPAGGGIEAPVGDAVAVEVAPDDLALEAADRTTGESPELRPSINADSNLLVGKRVRVKPSVQALTLRTEPGADAGDVVGYMEQGDEAYIVGGPTQLPGISDTIVWWQVQLDDGKQAWAAANTSDMTLLELAE